MDQSLSRITNVLVFKDGYYWLAQQVEARNCNYESYAIIPEIVCQAYNLHNGFEFASDAYSYLASLQSKQEPEYNPKEEERLKEMGETSG